MTPQTTAADHPSVPPARPFDPDLDPTPHRDPTADECERWAGKHVAWSWDGTTIVAGADTFEGLGEQLARAGIHWSRVVWSYIDEPGVSNL